MSPANITDLTYVESRKFPVLTNLCSTRDNSIQILQENVQL